MAINRPTYYEFYNGGWHPDSADEVPEAMVVPIPEGWYWWVRGKIDYTTTREEAIDAANAELQHKEELTP